jgi:chromosome segregation ATPase
MSTLTERNQVQSITAHADGRVEVVRLLQALRADEVVHSTTVSQAIAPGDELPAQLEPEVLAVIAAAWTPAKMDAARDALLARIRKNFDLVDAEQLARQERLAEAIRQNDAAEEALTRSRQAIQASHAELDTEHATLAERHETVTQARSDLFRRHEQIRAQHPKLDAVLKELAGEISAPPAPRGGRP